MPAFLNDSRTFQENFWSEGGIFHDRRNLARYIECRYAECCYAECRYTECHYADSRGAINFLFAALPHKFFIDKALLILTSRDLT
jgi:hypothetical protein